MRYRQLGPDGDYTIGLPFLTNSPSAVGQAVLTRLRLMQGEWFVDTSEGTPFYQSILGKHLGSNPNSYIKQRILQTTGIVSTSAIPVVSSIVSYTSSINGSTRALQVTATINTIFGTTTVST